MLSIRPYDREKAVEYARRWALGRNPRYFDFSDLGGDCTNFISQCVYAGAGQMNMTPTFGWYYHSIRDRSPSWSGVPYFYNFLTSNQSVGPFAEAVTAEDLQLGDVVQLGDFQGVFYHSLLVTGFTAQGPLVATHSYDAWNRPLESYSFQVYRCLHLEGIRYKTFQ